MNEVYAQLRHENAANLEVPRAAIQREQVATLLTAERTVVGVGAKHLALSTKAPNMARRLFEHDATSEVGPGARRLLRCVKGNYNPLLQSCVCAYGWTGQ
eukprot:6174462-Pleurochrysis_carterae.AAC.1